MNFANRMLAAAASLGMSAGMVYFEQQGTPAPGGTPAQAPGAANPQPAPSNPQPRQTTPSSNVPGPSAPSPNQNTQPGSTNPSTVPGTTQPSTVPAGSQPSGANGTANQYLRPFAFANPTYEARFTENAQRLSAMEQRLQRSNEALTKRLGEVRSLPPDRQNAAMFELLQQMLLEQNELNQYLVQARTAWSGDLPTTSGTQANVGTGTTTTTTTNTPR